jgi:ACS family hexuronate transporter-like MFS transporter
VRGFNLRQIASFAWIPYVSALIGGLVPGPLTTLLMRLGCSFNAARKGAIYGSAALMPIALGAAFVRSPYVAIAFVSLATFLMQIWASNLFALPADLFPSEKVGSVYGLAGAVGSLAAMMFTLLVGWVVDHFSYTPILVSVAFMHPVAAIVLHFTIPRISSTHPVK